MRPIDADALLNAIRSDYVFVGFKELLEDFLSIINEQPTIDAEPVKWIPVSERLPDEFKTVYVTIELCGKASTDFDRYDMTKNKWQAWGNKVLAWMPLPEPYNP